MTEQNENQAIEEMATIIAGTERVAMDVVGAPPSANMLAKAVYFAGYRKQIEGEWIYKWTGNCLGGTDAPLDYKCSFCGEFATDPFSYCPNCGATMK